MDMQMQTLFLGLQMTRIYLRSASFTFLAIKVKYDKDTLWQIFKMSSQIIFTYFLFISYGLCIF